MVDFLFLLASLSIASVGAVIVWSNVPSLLDSLCAWWLARHSVRCKGGLTFFALPCLSGSTYRPRPR